MKFFFKSKKLRENLINKENFILLIIILVIFYLDRLSKLKISNDFDQSVYYINDYINFDLVWNTGIGFGLLSSASPFIYHVITLIIGIVILILFYFLLVSEIIDKTILTIIIGGASGNFYDRFAYNAVPDFIDLHYKGFHWFTFNVADIFISCGILLYILRSFFIESKQ